MLIFNVLTIDTHYIFLCDRPVLFQQIRNKVGIAGERLELCQLANFSSNTLQSVDVLCLSASFKFVDVFISHATLFKRIQRGPYKFLHFCKSLASIWRNAENQLAG